MPSYPCIISIYTYIQCSLPLDTGKFPTHIWVVIVRAYPQIEVHTTSYELPR